MEHLYSTGPQSLFAERRLIAFAGGVENAGKDAEQREGQEAEKEITDPQKEGQKREEQAQKDLEGVAPQDAEAALGEQLLGNTPSTEANTNRPPAPPDDAAIKKEYDSFVKDRWKNPAYQNDDARMNMVATSNAILASYAQRGSPRYQLLWDRTAKEPALIRLGDPVVPTAAAITMEYQSFLATRWKNAGKNTAARKDAVEKSNAILDGYASRGAPRYRLEWDEKSRKPPKLVRVQATPEAPTTQGLPSGEIQGAEEGTGEGTASKVDGKDVKGAEAAPGGKSEGAREETGKNAAQESASKPNTVEGHLATMTAALKNGRESKEFRDAVNDFTEWTNSVTDPKARQEIIDGIPPGLIRDAILRSSSPLDSPPAKHAEKFPPVMRDALEAVKNGTQMLVEGVNSVIKAGMRSYDAAVDFLKAKIDPGKLFEAFTRAQEMNPQTAMNTKTVFDALVATGLLIPDTGSLKDFAEKKESILKQQQEAKKVIDDQFDALHRQLPGIVEGSKLELDYRKETIKNLGFTGRMMGRFTGALNDLERAEGVSNMRLTAAKSMMSLFDDFAKKNVSADKKIQAIQLAQEQLRDTKMIVWSQEQLDSHLKNLDRTETVLKAIDTGMETVTSFVPGGKYVYVGFREGTMVAGGKDAREAAVDGAFGVVKIPGLDYVPGGKAATKGVMEVAKKGFMPAMKNIGMSGLKESANGLKDSLVSTNIKKPLSDATKERLGVDPGRPEKKDADDALADAGESGLKGIGKAAVEIVKNKIKKT
ncbi:hypothetical protein HY213_02925 [Candidatus Peregrinibacteria bacterium]|nr:hypothetical protein [Candidatus Peregrinibacteria bacterium]